MKKKLIILSWVCLLAGWLLPCHAQQVMYASLKALNAQRGDTVSVLRVEKRTKKQIYLMGGNDYRIEAIENPGLSKYLRTRCYAVRVDSALYLNCRKLRYQRYRLGIWYAPALCVGRRVFFCAQPVGQEATRTLLPADGQKLGGDVGNAINASGLVDTRVYYELDLETGKALFVGKEYLASQLQGNERLLSELRAEPTEEASAMLKYIKQIKP